MTAHASDSADWNVVYPVRSAATRRLVVVCLLVIVVCVIATVLFRTSALPRWWLVVVIGAACVGAAAAAVTLVGWVWIAARPGRAIRLDTRGLTDQHTSLSSVGFVPWSAVVGVQAVLQNGQPLVAVLVQDPEAFVAGLRGVARTAARWSLRFGFGTPVLLNPVVVGLGGDELAHAVEEGLARYQASAKPPGA